jgi:carboxyl-terminal processing protease
MTTHRGARAPRFTLGLLCGAALTLALQAMADGAALPKSATDSFRQIVQVWDRIQAGYVTPVADERLRDGCLSGMLASLDPRSRYMDPTAYQSLRAIKGARLAIL